EAENPYRLSRRLEIERAPQTRSIYGGPLPDTEYLVLGALRPRPEIHKRIEKRLDERLRHGMVEEIQNLHKQGVPWEKLESFGLEYREVSRFLQGEMLFPDMRDHLLIKIRQFAKRQDTWFRKMEREGVAIHWLPPENIEEAEALCREFLA
ncbi:MAG TPA: tRNA (adenosine(37)-N6)-dimethylallyltransferase MiaA, partial [Lentisphaeria bacterium]|nr:tRNA (adenosine(37)-N6)-dimethylallyltransferase MiaA [Lentisphaeria bacterium]